MTVWLKRGVLALIVGLGLYAVYTALTREATTSAGNRRSGAGGFNPADLPVPVTAVAARLADIPVFLDGVGTARPAQSVTVRPQVDGRILKLHFREGQTVRQGDLLAELDSSTWRAQLDQVVARRTLTETQLSNAKRDQERYRRIPGVVAQKTVDTQDALVAQLEAQLKADDAAIANARAFLDYTRIHAPISGRTGLRQVDEGNLIRASGETGLVTISQLQPISVLFTLPQQALQAVKRAEARGSVKVDAIDADGKSVLDAGTLLVVDNQIEQTTGTVRMKADFPNAQQQLWPGQFVNIRLLADTLSQVVVVPTPAIQRGPDGPFVYLIGDDDRARVTRIETRLQTETETVVARGLTAGAQVITAGFARLSDNARVIAGPVGGAPPIPARTPPAGAGAGTGGGGGERFARIREACGGDLATHCPGVAREQMRACMEVNRTKFSAACQAVMGEPRDAAGKAAAGPSSRSVPQ